MLAHDFRFDTVQMPLNCFDGTYRSFEQQVLPELGRRGIAALAGSSPDPGDVPQDHACLAERRYLLGGAFATYAEILPVDACPTIRRGGLARPSFACYRMRDGQPGP